jgi:hypothetical protein
MKTIRVPSHVASLVIAAVVLLPMSPVLAGAPEGEQGSRVPGMPAASSQAAEKKHDGPVTVTFTKWLTTSVEPYLLKGVAKGDVSGDFAGEVLQLQVSTNPDLTQLLRLEAIYEVHADNPGHSFTALIRGGQTAAAGVGLLDGIIMSGWRAGAQVHVEFLRISSCAGNPAGPCFRGSIRIAGDSDE